MLPPYLFRQYFIALNPAERTPHMRKLLRKPLLRLAVLRLNGILNSTRNRIVHTQHGALNQFDFSRRVPPQSRPRRLSLLPRLGCRHRRRPRRRVRRHVVHPDAVFRLPVRHGFLVRRCGWEHGYPRVVQRVSSDRVARSVRIVEGAAEWTWLLAAEKGLFLLFLFVCGIGLSVSWTLSSVMPYSRCEALCSGNTDCPRSPRLAASQANADRVSPF